MCDMTHSYVWHNSFICATGHIHMCDMTHSYAWRDLFVCVTWWRMCVCDVMYSYVWHDAFMCMHDSFIYATRVVLHVRTHPWKLQLTLSFFRSFFLSWVSSPFPFEPVQCSCVVRRMDAKRPERVRETDSRWASLETEKRVARRVGFDDYHQYHRHIIWR